MKSKAGKIKKNWVKTLLNEQNGEKLEEMYESMDRSVTNFGGKIKEEGKLEENMSEFRQLIKR